MKEKMISHCGGIEYYERPELTELEQKVIRCVIEQYEGLEILTEDVLDALKESGIDSKTARGAIGSLVKKKYLKADDVNGEKTTLLPLGTDGEPL